MEGKRDGRLAGAIELRGVGHVVEQLLRPVPGAQARVILVDLTVGIRRSRERGCHQQVIVFEEPPEASGDRGVELEGVMEIESAEALALFVYRVGHGFEVLEAGFLSRRLFEFLDHRAVQDHPRDVHRLDEALPAVAG